MVFDNIVVGVDNSATTREAVMASIEMARVHGSSLHIVYAANVTQGPSRSRTGGYIDTEHPAVPLLEDLAGEAKKSGVEPCLHPTSDPPVDALVTVAGETDADLIIVGNKGMKGVSRVLGSIPNSIAHKAPCSVLIFDTEGAGEED